MELYIWKCYLEKTGETRKRCRGFVAIRPRCSKRQQTNRFTLESNQTTEWLAPNYHYFVFQSQPSSRSAFIRPVSTDNVCLEPANLICSCNCRLQESKWFLVVTVENCASFCVQYLIQTNSLFNVSCFVITHNKTMF